MNFYQNVRFAIYNVLFAIFFNMVYKKHTLYLLFRADAGLIKNTINTALNDVLWWMAGILQNAEGWQLEYLGQTMGAGMENDLKSASQNHLTYEQVHDLIAKHANDMLPLYADGSGSFPNGDPAVKIAARLRSAALFYSDLKNDLSNALDLAAVEIMDRAQGK